jgi:predicted Zn finger-like uncharacterized protein
MSMTTTCPKCNTNFRVTSEQLAAREGKLRCGRCSHVFNGFMYLGTPLEPLAERSLPVRPAGAPPKTPRITETEAPIPSPVSAKTEAPVKPPEIAKTDTPPITILPGMADSAPFQYQGKALPDEFLAKPAGELPVISIFQPPAPINPNIDLPDLAPIYQPEPWPIAKDIPGKIESHSPSAAPLRIPTDTVNINPVAPKPKAQPYDADDEFDEPLNDNFKEYLEEDEDFDGPTLLDDAANKRAKPHWVWAVGGLLLFFTAALQALYLFRVDVAQTLPEVRPLMTQACSMLNCQVGLPQNLDTLSIESSDLVADPTKPDQIELRATLRNKARYAQAYPNLDFNLTDAQDETLVKRIIAPATYLKPPATPSTGFAPNSEINIKLNFKAQDVKPAGYRLLLFYP